VSILNSGIHNVPGGLNVNLPASAENAGALAYTLLGRNFALDLELSALQREGRGEVLSNPRVVASNQREAVIRHGREVGYVTLTGGGNQGFATPNVQFKEVVLELKVTPTITADDRVFMAVNVLKDEILGYIDTSIGQVPEIATREINTAVLVDDGQTVVIGGVYEFTDTNSVPNVQFKEVVLELKVTPTITADDRVFMAVNVLKDEILGYIDTSIGQVPEIATREINTAVLVDDGQTVVIGGVYEFTDTNSVSKV